MIHVRDFGASECMDDNAPAINEAIQFAIKTNQVLHFDPVIYKVGSPLVIDNFLTLRGAPRSGNIEADGGGTGRTEIRAVSLMRSVFEFATNNSFNVRVDMRDIIADGNNNANHGLYLSGVSFSEFRNVGAIRCLSDGIHCTRESDNGRYVINDQNRWLNCGAGSCGIVRRTIELLRNDTNPQLNELYENARVQCIEGSNIISFDGVDLRDWNLRAGDPLFFGDPIEWRGEERLEGEFFTTFVGLLNGTDMIVGDIVPFTRANMHFCVCSGDGYHEERHGDNNINIFEGGLVRGNAGYGFVFDGLYGPNVTSVQVDFHPTWGMRFGTRGGNPVIKAQVNDCYFETLGASPVLLKSTEQFLMIGPMAKGWDDAGTTIDLRSPQANATWMLIDKNGISGGDGCRNFLRTSSLEGAKVSKGLFFQGQTLASYDPSSTMTLRESYVEIREPQGWDGNDVVLNGNPVFTFQPGKVMTIYNAGGANIILLDRRAGTGLQLESAQVVLLPKSTIHLRCAGGFWRQDGPITRVY